MVIKRVGAMSIAKVAAVLYAGIGLLFGGILALVSMAGFSALGQGSDAPSFLGPMLGVGAIIILPICYGIIGFIGTLIAASLFNLAAGMTGGVEIEVQ